MSQANEHYTEVERRLQTVPTTNTSTNIAVEDKDKEVKDEGSCPDANPLVSSNDALIVLLLGIFIPGTGAMFAAYRGKDGFNCKCCGFGVAQMMTTLIIVGTVWSIIQCVNIYTKSTDYYSTTTIVTASSSTKTGTRRLNAKKID